jgi:hypothetical protein
MISGPCAAPRSTESMRRPFWKLAALDVQLGEFNPIDSFGVGPHFISRFLGPAWISQNPQTIVCSLSMYESAALDYVVAAHASQRHPLCLQHVFAFGVAKPSAAAADSFPGLISTITPAVTLPTPQSSQEEKVLAFNEAMSDVVSATVGTADVVLGSLQHCPEMVLL